MKVLFDHPNPFLFAHGGFQIQIEQTRAALEAIGIEVEFLRWWDPSQRGDIVHFFNLPPATYTTLARNKGIKVVITHLLGGLGARSKGKRFLQKILIGAALRILPTGALARLGWQVWQTADAYIAVTPWEAELMTQIFRVPRERVHVIPNGVNKCFFQQRAEIRDEYLVTTASILAVKRIVETAQAAVAAETPYWIIGRPFSEADAYFSEFSMLCQRNPEILRYDGIMRRPEELAEIYAQARGFVLLSRWETQSLSALEAAASGCPLLLSDLPWAHATFADSASYCPIGSTDNTARYLRKFYDESPSLPPPLTPVTWNEVAKMLTNVYQGVMTLGQ